MFKKESLPTSWSLLTWQQLTEAWTVKQRFGGNPHVAAAAALLALGELRVTGQAAVSSDTGETVKILFEYVKDAVTTWQRSVRTLILENRWPEEEYISNEDLINK